MAGNRHTAVLRGLQKGEKEGKESPAITLFTLLGASCSTGGLSMVALDPGHSTALLGYTMTQWELRTLGWDLGPS